MLAIGPDTLAQVRFRLLWQEDGITHEDCLVAQRLNFWRDCSPGPLAGLLAGLAPGETRGLELSPVAPDPARVVTVPRRAFQPPVSTPLFRGRFLPQGVFRGLPGVFPQNIRPCRVVRLAEDAITVDTNHPLAGVAARLEVTALEVWLKESELGGSCQDWLERVLDGPGLKRGMAGGVDFPAEPYSRQAADADAVCYATPRRVGHVDAQASARITALYEELLAGRPRVLDLMAGWQSHLPAGMQATGLGMNAEEMAHNPALAGFVVHDLNADPVLPWPEGAFDAVVCALSVEYLRRPVAVLGEVRRVLAPGGVVAVVVSHRWFPGWAVDLWGELHEFERVGLVVHWLRQAGFTALATLSDRGWPRPQDARDRYYPRLQDADPIHAVWGTRG